MGYDGEKKPRVKKRIMVMVATTNTRMKACKREYEWGLDIIAVTCPCG
jgi:hypothetical protein